MNITFYTAKEVGEKLKVTPATVRIYIARKQLEAMKFSDRCYRIPDYALHKFIESKKQ